ncbi:MAG: tetratricopeptide repeat protein [Dehalococcoidia bacterium]|nr:tetratricopeptide repeat protein [Dehalococcoidia bacterium]
MFFFKPDEGTKHYRDGLRYLDPNGQDFDIEKAIEQLKAAVGLKPWAPTYHSELGHAYLAAPLFAVTRGVKVKFSLPVSAKLAIPELEEAVRLNPKDGWSRCWLGLAYEYLGQKKKAIETYRPVLKLKGRRWMWLRKNVEQCIVRLEGKSNMETDRDRARVLINEAIEYRNKGDYTEATRVFEEAIRLAPNSEWLYKTACETGGNKAK